MRKLADQIGTRVVIWGAGALRIYEDELQRLWPLDQKDREAMIAQFAEECGFRLRFYKKGLCAIFDRRPGRKES
jgi:hypothetical protein